MASGLTTVATDLTQQWDTQSAFCLEPTVAPGSSQGNGLPVSLLAPESVVDTSQQSTCSPVTNSQSLSPERVSGPKTNQSGVGETVARGQEDALRRVFQL